MDNNLSSNYEAEKSNSSMVSPDALSLVDDFARRNRVAVLTIMFEDMVGSTVLLDQISQELGEQAFHHLREEHDRRLHEIVNRDGAGQVVKSTGDGILAIFTAPSVAVERAIEIQEAFYGDRWLKLRIGLDMGQVTQPGEGLSADVFGLRVACAARITGMAEGGHVLVTDTVYREATRWLPRKRVSWHHHGQYHSKPEEPFLDVYEPFNANLGKVQTEPRGLKNQSQTHLTGFEPNVADVNTPSLSSSWFILSMASLLLISIGIYFFKHNLYMVGATLSLVVTIGVGIYIIKIPKTPNLSLYLNALILVFALISLGFQGCFLQVKIPHFCKIFSPGTSGEFYVRNYHNQSHFHPHNIKFHLP